MRDRDSGQATVHGFDWLPEDPSDVTIEVVRLASVNGSAVIGIRVYPSTVDDLPMPRRTTEKWTQRRADIQIAVSPKGRSVRVWPIFGNVQVYER